MRQADKHALGDKAEPSIYSGGTADHELKTFKGFLKNGTEIDSHRSGKARVMPERWSEESIQKCMDFVTNGDAKVTVKTQKSDLIDFYKDEDMPMQLRMFGQFFDGHTSGGMPCETMLAMRVGGETGSTPFQTRIDFSQVQGR